MEYDLKDFVEQQLLRHILLVLKAKTSTLSLIKKMIKEKRRKEKQDKSLPLKNKERWIDRIKSQ